MEKMLFVSELNEDAKCPPDCHGEANENALLHLQTYTRDGDPLVHLNQYYQKQGVLSISCNFLPPQSIRKGEGKDSTIFWRYTFACPLVKSKVVSSIVAGPLLWGNPSSQLVQLWTKWFGKFDFDDNGNIFLGTKQNAKRSAALAMLIQIFGTVGPEIRTTMSASTAAAPQLMGPSIKSLNRLRRRPIDWVDRLHRLGIRDLNIAYQEYEPYFFPGSPVSTNSTWNGAPILLTCRIEVMISLKNQKETPSTSVVVGSPQPTRRLALFDAVDNLERLMVAQCKIRGVVAPTADDDTTIMCGESLQSLTEKHRILESDTSICSYRMHLPYWATINVLDEFSMARPLLLFEVFLTTTTSSQKDLPRQITRLGLLLPWCPELLCQSRFSATFCNGVGKNKIHHVEIVYRGCISPYYETHQSKFGALLQDWTILCQNWKTYGGKNQADFSKLHCRKYVFVPLVDPKLIPSSHQFLPTVLIDWLMIDEVVNDRKISYMTACIRFDKIMQRLLILLVNLVIFSAVAMENGMTVSTATKLFCVALILLGIQTWQSPSHRFFYQYHLAKNRFLSHATKGTAIFVPSKRQNIGLTAKSSRAQLLEERPQQPNTRTRKPVESFHDYFLRRYGIRLKHINIPLLTAHKVNKMSDWLQHHGYDQNRLKVIGLMPELTHILPMPQDVLWSMSLVENFMPPLERSIIVKCTSKNLQQLALQQTSLGEQQSIFRQQLSSQPSPVCDSPLYMSPLGKINNDPPKLEDILALATAVYPIKSYERLEFLGDKVVHWFTVLTLFSQNARLQWDHDDFGYHCGAAVRNTALAEGALRAGLVRFIGTGRWKLPSIGDNKHASTLRNKVALADSTLSDITESLLATVYLDEVSRGDNSVGPMVLAILELLQLPLPQRAVGSPWFGAFGVCIQESYPISRDPGWHNQLRRVHQTLEQDKLFSSEMMLKMEELIDIILSNMPSQIERSAIRYRLLQDHDCRTLMFAAITDANLDGTDEGALKGVANSPRRMEELQQLGILRDTIFHIGNSALELMLSQDLFELYPEATPGDLHLLKTCAISDDALVYILVHWKLHECLFDQSPLCLLPIRGIILTADRIGQSFWEDNDGWIMPGGKMSYERRRWNVFSKRPDGGPRYPGLAGGRIHGQAAKIEADLTCDWQFSFKCIIGALSLSLGTNATWYKIARPFFEELMLLTPAEYRELFERFSSICRVYGPGNKNPVQ